MAQFLKAVNREELLVSNTWVSIGCFQSNLRDFGPVPPVEPYDRSHEGASTSPGDTRIDDSTGQRLSGIRNFANSRPYLGAVLGGVSVACMATAIDTLTGGGDFGTTYAPQAFVLTIPIIITFLYRRDGSEARGDRAGLVAVSVVAVLVLLVGVAVMVRGSNTGQIVLGAVVAILAVAIGFIGVGQLARSTGK